jgi:hypothetical protein
MPDAVTRHAPSSASWREDLVSLLDITNAIISGSALLALPVLVMAPGLIALLALGIPLLLPLVALGLVFAILSVPFAALWWLVRMARKVAARRRKGRPPRSRPRDPAPLPTPQPEVGEVAI